jgi:hypothetical protein
VVILRDLCLSQKQILPKLSEGTVFEWNFAMMELTYKQGCFYTSSEFEDELWATPIEIEEFKKQFDAMTGEEKARFPTWLRAQLEKM